MKDLLIIALLLTFFGANSQEKYWVYFTDKNNVSFEAENYFHPNAIARRNRISYPLNHSTDLPVNMLYKSEVSNRVDEYLGASRWLNAAVVMANEEQIEAIEKLPFVKHVEPSGFVKMICSTEESVESDSDFERQDLMRFQIERMQADKFAANGYRGKGIRIAIFDAGFPGVDEAEMFEHIRSRDGIKGTYDFIRKTENVYRKISHGSTVLSCIAGIAGDSIMLGVAPDADFLLAITEKLMKEGLAEEEAWLFAAEWADKNGVDIINSSLGYTRRSHFKTDMDGNTTVITKAANLASSKGILVVSSAGNEGNKNNWMMMAAPADGDSVLAVGAINPWSGFHTSFSSFGPSADKELKPNVTGVGHVVAYGVNDKLHMTQGTSFSAPLIAGFAACAWQANPGLSNWELLKRIEQSGDLYPYFDYAHGYGVPQATAFLQDQPKQALHPDSLFNIHIEQETITVGIRDEYLNQDSLDVENNLPDRVANKIMERINENVNLPIDEDHPFEKRELFYYHIENNANYLDEFSVVSVDENPILQLDIENLNGTLRFHYRGVTKEIHF